MEKAPRKSIHLFVKTPSLLSKNQKLRMGNNSYARPLFVTLMACFDPVEKEGVDQADRVRICSSKMGMPMQRAFIGTPVWRIILFDCRVRYIM